MSIDIRQVLLAGAAGDCAGGPFEGTAGGKGVARGPWKLSDDTVLTMATCRGIIDAGQVDPAAIARGLVAAFQAGEVRGAGSSTLKALRDLASGVHWALAGHGGEFSAGNGAAMRIAPLTLFVSGETAAERQLVRDVCRITHKNDEAYVAALAVLRAMHTGGVITDAGRLLADVAAQLPDTGVRDALSALARMPAGRSIADVARSCGTSGHARESVPFAIYLAARFHGSCTGAIVAAIEAGGDTDTIAALAGQLVAAWGGALDEDWVARIPRRGEIEKLAAQLDALASRRL